MFHHRFANGTQCIICISNQWKLENTKSEPNNTHISLPTLLGCLPLDCTQCTKISWSRIKPSTTPFLPSGRLQSTCRFRLLPFFLLYSNIPYLVLKWSLKRIEGHAVTTSPLSHTQSTFDLKAAFPYIGHSTTVEQ